MIKRYEIVRHYSGNYRVIDHLKDDFATIYISEKSEERCRLIMGKEMDKLIEEPQYAGIESEVTDG
jgi:hypothetical protein